MCCYMHIAPYFGYLSILCNIPNFACRPLYLLLSSLKLLSGFLPSPHLFAAGVLFYILTRHLCAFNFYTSTLLDSFCGPSHIVPAYFAYPSTLLIFSHVMLSMHFMFFLRGHSPLRSLFLLDIFSCSNFPSPHGLLLPLFFYFYPGLYATYMFASRGSHTLLYLILASLQRLFHLGYLKCAFSQRLSLSTAALTQFGVMTLSAATLDILPSTFITFDVDTYDVAFDNCTSYCVTNDKRDFIFNDFIPADPASVPIHGVGGPSSPLGFGTVLWRFRDDNHLLHSVRIPHVAYLPSCPLRLCCPQALSRDVFADLDTNGTFITTYGTHSLLVFNHHQFECTIVHPPRSGIPILTCGPGLTTFRQFFEGPFTALYGSSLIAMPRPSLQCPPGDSNPCSNVLPRSGSAPPIAASVSGVHHLPALVHPVVPLSPAQLELLRLHSRLGHMHLSVVQSMIISKQIHTSVRDTSTCPLPKCAACLYGKLRRKPWRTKKPPGSVISSLMSMPFLLPAGPLRPGSASIDHFSCSEPGLVGHSKGALTLKSFRGGTVCVETESMVSYVHLQTSLNADQTLLGKCTFERQMAKYGWAIVTYRSVNVSSPIMSSKQPSWPLTNPSHIAVLVAIIKML